MEVGHNSVIDADGVVAGSAIDNKLRKLILCILFFLAVYADSISGGSGFAKHNSGVGGNGNLVVSVGAEGVRNFLFGYVGHGLAQTADILAGLGLDIVRTADNSVAAAALAVAGSDSVLALAAVDSVVTSPAIDVIISSASNNGVVAAAATNIVVAASAVNGVIAVSAVDFILSIAAVNDVVAVSAVNGIGQRGFADE